MQKQFERLRLHQKQPNGLNIWTCEVTGPRKSRRLHGYLLVEPGRLFDSMPVNNPFLKLLDGGAPLSAVQQQEQDARPPTGEGTRRS